MIERTIKLYKNLGFKDFLILVYHSADSVKKLLGNGEKYGVNIIYSEDPGKPVGRGGALKHALNQKLLKSSHELFIIHNPDDQIVNTDEKSAEQILQHAIEEHVVNAALGSVATAVMVRGVNFDFTGFIVEKNKVVGVEMYPFIKIPTHIGLTFFAPSVLSYIDSLFTTDVKSDFEAVLFPKLVSEGGLASYIIPDNTWISVNDEKGLKKLLKVISTQKKDT
jgi:NDP-sugar pyrophosphorylase family protein